MAIGSFWDVELVLEEQRLAIQLESVAGESFCCSGCGEKCSLKDHLNAVAMDMWLAFANSAERHEPEAEIVHNRFHISAA